MKLINLVIGKNINIKNHIEGGKKHLKRKLLSNSAIENVLMDSTIKMLDRYVGSNTLLAKRPIIEPILPLVKIPIYVAEQANASTENFLSLENCLEKFRTGDLNHCFLIGEGGMGKTYSLYNIWKYYIENYNLEKVIPIYLSLNELSESEKSYKNNLLQYIIDMYLGKDNSDDIKLSIKKYFQDQPNKSCCRVLLMLDGYNEVTKNTQDILNCIDDFSSKYKNVQIVITSRKNLTSLTQLQCFYRIYLQELSDYVIQEFLKSKKIVLQDFEAQLWNILRNPMMLTIFGEVYELSKAAQGELPSLHCYSSGELLRDYFDRLSQARALQDYQRETLISTKYIIPYIGWRMERDNLWQIDKIYIVDIIDEALKELKKNWRFIKKIIDPDMIIDPEFVETLNSNHIMAIIELHLAYFQSIDKNGEVKLSFLHQHIRDFMAASYIFVQMKFAIIQNSVVPLKKVFSSSLCSGPVSRFIGELCSEHKYRAVLNRSGLWSIPEMPRKYSMIETQKSLDLLRNKFGDGNEWCVRCIVDIISITRRELAGCNLSCLDLTKTSINSIICSRYSNGQYLAANFSGSLLNNETLLPTGHSAGVGCLTVIHDYYLLSMAADGIICYSLPQKNVVKEMIDLSVICKIDYKEHFRIIDCCTFSDSVDGDVKKTYFVTIDLVGNIVLWEASSSIYSECDLKLTELDQQYNKNKPISKLAKGDQKESFFVSYCDGSIEEYSILNRKLQRSKLIWESQRENIKGHMRRFCSISFDKQNHRLIFSWKLSLYYYDIDTQKVNSISLDFPEEITNLRNVQIRNLEYSKISNSLILSISSVSKNFLLIYKIKENEFVCLQNLQNQKEEDDTSFGHIAFSEKENLFLITSNNGRIYEYEYRDDNKTYQIIREYHEPEGLHSNMAMKYAIYYRADYVISASIDRSTKVWDHSNGWIITSISGYYNGLRKMAADISGRYIWIASYDSTVIQWDIRDKKVVQKLIGHTGWVWDVKQLNDNEVVSCSDDKVVKLWNTSTGTVLKNIKTHKEKVQAVTACENTFYSVGDDGRVYLHKRGEKGDSEPIFLGDFAFKHRILSITHSSDFKRLLLGGANEYDQRDINYDKLADEKKNLTKMIGYSLEDGKLELKSEWHNGWFRDIKYSADNKWILVSGLIKNVNLEDREHIVFLWENRERGYLGEPTYILTGHTNYVVRAQFYPSNVDGKDLIVFTASEDNTVNIYLINENNKKICEPQIRLKHASYVFDIIFSQDSNICYTIDLNGYLYSWDCKKIFTQSKGSQLEYTDNRFCSIEFRNVCGLWVSGCDFSRLQLKAVLSNEMLDALKRHNSQIGWRNDNEIK